MNAVTATKLIGTVKVQPTTVRPGEPVFVQVCDSNGRPYTGTSGVRVTIEGVEAPARFCQFAVAGTVHLTVCATQGDLMETSVVTVQVTGEPRTFRRTLSGPALTAMPIIQLRQSLGSPYLAAFDLGTPESLLPSLAQKHTPAMTTNMANAGSAAGNAARIGPAVDLAKLSGNVNTPPGADQATSGVDLQSAVAKAFSSLPAATVTQVPATTLTNKNGTKVTGSGCFAQVPGGVEAKPVATSYRWDFGDGTAVTTQSPTVSHDFFPSIQAGKVAHSFDVTCTVEHDHLTVKRTLVLHSAYGLCRRLGTIVPHVNGDVFATNQQIAFSGSMIVHNIEAEAITLNQMACVALCNDSTEDLPAPQFTAMNNPVTIQGNSATGLGVYVPIAQLQQMSKMGQNVPGFMLQFTGTAADRKTPVRFSHTFRIPLTDSGLTSGTLPANSTAPNFDCTPALQAVSAIATDSKCGVSRPGCQMVDRATNTVAIALSADVHSPSTLAQVRCAVQAGLTSIATSMGIPAATQTTSGALATGAVQQDQACDGDAASAAARQLVCQLTDGNSTVVMQGSFRNALKGDVVLSPGGGAADQMISNLMRGFNPPQYHSNCGIMTQNFVEFTHCTSSADRLADNTTGIGGASGIQPDVLQFGWPGSITQTIDAAMNGEPRIDPNGKTYNVGAFTAEALGTMANGDFVLTPALVVKPVPENEGTVRPMLRQAANTARSKGGRVDLNGNLTQKPGCYYSLFAYTKPEISAGFANPAGTEAGWAQGLSPAVGSSFVWLCMKQNELPLVTSKPFGAPSDLSATAASQGARFGENTMDGLFYYPQAERQEAAQILNQMLENQVLQHEGFFRHIPLLSSDVASNIADQMMNMFAFNNPNMYGSSAWLAPGDANAVSPDNVTCWSMPAFGYAEPLQFLPSHTVNREMRMLDRATISGVVTLNGAPVNNANVTVDNGKSAVCNSNGQFELGNVPSGNCNLTAVAMVNGMRFSATLPVNLTGANLTVNIPLQPLPMDYRQMDLLYQFSCDHSDDNPFNTHGLQSAGPDQQSMKLGPGQVTNSCTCAFDYDGGGYFRIQYQMSAVLAEDLSIQMTVMGTMFDDANGSVQGERSITFNVPAGGQCAFELDLECEALGFHNGPSKFTGTATNNQEIS